MVHRTPVGLSGKQRQASDNFSTGYPLSQEHPWSDACVFTFNSNSNTFSHSKIVQGHSNATKLNFLRNFLQKNFPNSSRKISRYPLIDKNTPKINPNPKNRTNTKVKYLKFIQIHLLITDLIFVFSPRKTKRYNSIINITIIKKIISSPLIDYEIRCKHVLTDKNSHNS